MRMLALAVLLVTACSTLCAQTLERQLASMPIETLEKRCRVLGDAENGARIFHRAELACTQCHTAGAGQKLLGPDLSQMRERGTAAHVIESILNPSKRMEKGYEAKNLLLSSGQVLAGMIREATDDEYVVAIPGEKELRRIAIDDVEAEKDGQSMMPTGLTNLLAGEREFYDLVSYLTRVADAGPDKAAKLFPGVAVAPPPLPEYESDLDHAGLIRSWNEDTFKRGKKIYSNICVNCHGTVAQAGSLPNALRFASGKFKNGSDPWSMYKTITHGYAMMLPQRQLVPEQKYQVIHYIREAFLKEHNESQYVSVSNEYLASLPKGQRRGPAATVSEPWRDMDYGPFLISTYEMVGPKTGPRLGVTREEQQRAAREKRPPNEQWADDTNFAFKGIAVKLDDAPGGVSHGSNWVAFDHDTLRVAGAWSGSGFIDWHGILFDGRHAITPRTVGDQSFANPQGPGWAHPDTGSFEDPRLRGRDGRPYGPLPREWAHYKGLYKHGNNVVIKYTVGETAVLETPKLARVDGMDVVQRIINLAPHDKPLTMRIAHRPGQSQLVPVGDGVVRVRDNSQKADSPSPEEDSFAFDGRSRLEIADGKAFEMRDSDFTVTATIKTDTGGTIFAKTAKSGPWIPDGKTLFVRGGKLCYDIGWVGAVVSRRPVADGKTHRVAVRYTAETGEVELFIDGRPDGDGTLKPKDTVRNHVARIGFTAEDFPRDKSFFEGDIADVRFFQRALADKELKTIGKAKPLDESDLLAHWSPTRDATKTVRNTHDDQHHAAVVRGKRPKPKRMGSLLAGISGDRTGTRWSAVEGHLEIELLPNDQPQQFTVWVANEGGQERRGKIRVPDATRDLVEWTKGGPAQWPRTLKTAPETGDESGAFAVDVLTRPTDNPWKSRLRMSGLDFYDDGDSLVACCCDGDVWRIEGLHNPDAISWRRIASGLFHPLGIKIVDERIFVTCRDQIVILNDLNGDGETDFYESFNNDHQVTDHFHEFAMGLQADADGNLYYAKSARHARDSLVPHHGTLLKVSADGSNTRIVANGFRAANGVCLNPDGSFFVTDQEGHWTPMNRINRVTQGGFYGNMYSYGAPSDTSDEAMDMPLCWPNKEFDRSPSELLWVNSDRWGGLNGSLLNLSYGYGKVYVVPHDQVDGQWQGGMCRLPLPQFPTGVMRARFHPGDGQMYACGMHAWGSNQSASKGGLYRIRATGNPMHMPVGLKARGNQLEITFTDPVDPESAADPGNYLVESWDLKRTANYGSKRHDQKTLAISRVDVSDDARTVRLQIPDLRPTWCMQIAYGMRDASGAKFQGVIQNTIYDLGE